MKNNKVKSTINRLIHNKTYRIYDEINDLFKEYNSVVLPEQDKLNGHTHFRAKEIEEKVLSLIEEDERVLLIQDEEVYNRNIGMKAAMLKLEEIVLRSLDNYEASIQQGSALHNIGMMAAQNGLEKATLKALDNAEASIQQDNFGKNIGMYAISSKLIDASMKAIPSCKITF